MGSKKAQAAETPAVRPVREEALSPEDVILGGTEEDTTGKAKGKRALLRPAADSTPTTGLSV